MDCELCVPLVNPGAHFHRNETAAMVLDGGIPTGAVLCRYCQHYLVYYGALYALDADGYILSDAPALVAYEHRIHGGRWQRG
jgi:hypothetical protein